MQACIIPPRALAPRSLASDMSFPEPPAVQRKFRSLSGGLLGGQNSRPHSAHSAQSASSNSSYESYWPSSSPAPGHTSHPIPMSGSATPGALSLSPLLTPGSGRRDREREREREEGVGGYSRLLDRFKKLTLELELKEVAVKQLEEELESSRESKEQIETFLSGGSDSEDWLRTSEREDLIVHCRKQEIRLRQLGKKISELEFSIHSKKKLVARRDDTIKSILNQMQSKTLELKQLQDFVSGAAPRSPIHSSLELEQSETAIRRKEMERRVSELEADLSAAHARLSDTQRDLVACQGERRRVVELEKQLGAMETKNKELGGLLQTRSQHIAHLEGSVAELSQIVAELHTAKVDTSLNPSTPDRIPADPSPVLAKLSSIISSADKMCTGGQGSSSLGAAQVSILRAELKEKERILSRQREQLNRLSELKTNSSPQPASWLDAKERENLESIIRELNADKQQMTEQLVQQDTELNTQRLHITGLLTELDEEKRESCAQREKGLQLGSELTESGDRIRELEKIVENRGKKIHQYKRGQQADRAQQLQAIGAQREMRGEYEEQLDRVRGELTTERRRSVELSEALQNGVTVVLDREKELGEERRLVTDLLADLKSVTTFEMDINLFRQERKRIVQEAITERRDQYRELTVLRQELLQHAISEKDAHIALIEMKLPGKDEVDLRLQRTRLQKERLLLVEQLKKENKTLSELLEPNLNALSASSFPLSSQIISSRGSGRGQGQESLVIQLAESSMQEVKQCLIQVFTGIQQLRLYLDQILALILEYKPSLLEGMPRIQVTPYSLDTPGAGAAIAGEWDDLSRDELLRQLEVYEKDNIALQQYISQLLERVVVQLPYLVEKIVKIDKPIVNILKEN